MEITKLFPEGIFENFMPNAVAASQLWATRGFVMWLLASFSRKLKNSF
ncbi:hypothetical protein [Butyrivibrio sp. VCB2001]|nr:hypothetical protein [Butyrivibrio sp. VCB2001]